MTSTCALGAARWPRSAIVAALTLTALCARQPSEAQTAAPAPPAADQVVQALEGNFGVHAGQRRNHTKGSCAIGEFKGLPAAGRYTRAAIFHGQVIPVVARFSLPGGNPNAPDTARTPRGLAMELRLPDGKRQHFTLLNTPMFGAATPQTFLDNLLATRADPATGKPDPAKVAAFRRTHPDSQAQADYLAHHRPPPSWARTTYYGIHTFVLTRQDGQTTPARWRFVPEDGEAELSEHELGTLPHDFLESRLIARTRQGPVRWHMLLTIGQPGDPQDNATLPWPADRTEVEVATLSITQATPQKGAACETINFDPLVMVDGLSPSQDPVLLFRSPAYAVSFGRRLNGQ